MNVSLMNSDAISGIIKLEIEKKDYEAQVEKSLRQYRQKANFPGFRKGMVPLGMVKKMYGKYILVEEVNKVASENLFKYIRDNQINILGEPLPSESEIPVLDFDTQENFEFYFDIALAPALDIKLSKRDKVDYFQLQVTDDMLNKQIESYRKNFGSYDSAESVEETDLVKGIITELENGQSKEGGVRNEEGVLMPTYIKDNDEQKKFIGAKINDSIVFNPNKAYEGKEAEIASFLKVPKESVAEIVNDFTFEIKEITRHKEADLNQELFDKVFGENTVSNESEFVERVKASIVEQLKPQSDYKFMKDVRELLIKKAGDVKFADSILKRWLLAANENTTQEKVEEDYPLVMEDLKFHLAKQQVIKDNNLNVEEADVEDLAKRVAKSQFAQYGMLSVPDDVLDNYAKDMLKKKETAQNIIDRAVEEKLAEWVKNQVKIEAKEVSLEEFQELLA